jgi:CPA1 family monovalent cation:H+ antiporter
LTGQSAGDSFPERATIQAIAFVVSVGTLLIQGATLPLLISRLHLSADETAYEREQTLKEERVVHDAADEVLAEFRANPADGLDPRVLAEIRNTIARHSQDADEMPDPATHTLRAEVFRVAVSRRAEGAAGGADRRTR